MARTPERPGERVAADLRQRIAAGEWEPDTALPTVAALADHYHVSKATITRVLRTLADEGAGARRATVGHVPGVTAGLATYL